MTLSKIGPETIGLTYNILSGRGNYTTVPLSLADDKLLFIYSRDAGPNYGLGAIVLTSDGTPYGEGSEYVTDTSNAMGAISAVYVEDDKVAVFYEDVTATAKYVRFITTSGSVVTFGTAQSSFWGATGSLNRIGYFPGTSTLVLMANQNPGGTRTLFLRLMTFTGTTLSTPGSTVTLENTATWGEASNDSYDVAGLSSTGGACVYYHNTDLTTAQCRAFTFSGTTITLGSQTDFGTSEPAVDVTCEMLDTDKMLTGFTDNSGTYQECKAKVVTVSGTTITPGTTEDLDSLGTEDSLFNMDSLLVFSSTRAAVVQTTGFGGSDAAYAVDMSISGTTITSGSRLTLLSAGNWAYEDWFTGGAYGADAGGVFSTQYATGIEVWELLTGASPAPDSGVYAIALSNDVENDGTKGFLTIWRDGTLYLQKWDLVTLTVDFEVPLGAATLDEVQARTKIAYPFALSDQEAFIYGLMADPAYLSGSIQLLMTTTGGGSGTWSDQSPGDWDGSHILAGFYAGANSGGGRPWYGVRCSTGTPPRFFYGLDSLADVSAIPLTAGTIIRHGAFHISRRESAVVGADYGEGSTIYEADPYWNSWIDFTYDHPSGSHEVLRFF